MVLLYWDIGQTILNRQDEQGWGAKIIDRLSEDLKEAFPEMNGFSPRNLKYMRKFAEQWPNREIVQEALAQITCITIWPFWRNVKNLKLDSGVLVKRLKMGGAGMSSLCRSKACFISDRAKRPIILPSPCRRKIQTWLRRSSKTPTFSTFLAPPTPEKNAKSSRR
jgi:hypothetical protein